MSFALLVFAFAMKSIEERATGNRLEFQSAVAAAVTASRIKLRKFNVCRRRDSSVSAATVD